jgi:hypothetical protein
LKWAFFFLQGCQAMLEQTEGKKKAFAAESGEWA